VVQKLSNSATTVITETVLAVTDLGRRLEPCDRLRCTWPGI